MISNLTLIIIDANFILLPFQFKIDYLYEIRANLDGTLKFIVFQQILNELEAKRKREPKATKFIRLLNSGLSYLEKNKERFEIEFIEDIKGIDETTDDFMLRKLTKLKENYQSVFLATNDSELRRRSKKLSINVIFLRQKKYLSFERA
ncbi:MAG: type II toxin-antitoxin system VapC family toxin [Promethearchaeota archaeon]